MSQFRVGLAVTAMIAAVAMPAVLSGGGVAYAVPSNLGPCTGDLTGTTFTLTAACSTTAPIAVPGTITTVDGGGFTITATDAGGAQWNGGIMTNASPGQSMTIQNLTISGPATGFQLCTISTNVLYGIWFNDASGSVNNVTVQHIFQQQNGAFGSCQTGRAIRADAVTAARTVTITNTTVEDYQKSGFEARDLGASMTMDVSTSTAGPPHPLTGLIAQNAVSMVGASGTIANNTIIGSGDQMPGVGGSTDGTGVLLFGANNVTVDHNTITGAGTDIGVAVAADSTNITISFNTVGRTAPDSPDPTGHGIDVDHPGSNATLICNTFSGWNTNIVGAVQISCTPLPDGTQCEPYPASTLTVEGGTAPYTWSVVPGAGTLPPGLSLSTDGTITGTPTEAGTFEFTVQVTDSTTDTPLMATQAESITIAPNCAPPPTSGFFIGNSSATSGKAVNFWGSQWSETNALSGGTAPAAFKGFADSTTGLTCGSTWTTSTGNSSHPPATIAGIINVMVTSSVVQKGSVISGTAVHVVRLQVNPGYGPAPGHAGWGTVIGVVC
jgi:hypothetical protein